MEVDWNVYIHRNKSEGDCQLIALANAYIYLTGNVVHNDLYEELIKKCGCIAGSCINAKPAFEAFGLQVKKSYRWLVENQDVLPLEINTWHKYFGFHTILAVGWEPQTRSFRVINFRHVANTAGWIFYEDLMHFTIMNPNKTKPNWMSRTLTNSREEC